MKRILNLLIIPILLYSTAFAQEIQEFYFFEKIELALENKLDAERIDELVSIKVQDLKALNNTFNEDAFIVYEKDEEVPSQLFDDDGEKTIKVILNFSPKEMKKIVIKYQKDGKLIKSYENRTYAELAMKFDAVFKDKKFTRDRFQNYSKVVVPEIHTDHDALFKYEGPGWESELVGYRFYLDWRNATDIFGKKIKKLVLSEVGVNDVIAQDDSYHEMHEWGMDIFKVGSSLGIGSIGMMNEGKINMVSKTDQIICEISNNGPLVSEVTTQYRGWTVGKEKYDLIARLSIAGGSRITHVNLDLTNSPDNITTGLAKHENTEFVLSDNDGDWAYIALFGKQTLADDNAGIVLFYKKSNLINNGDDELNYYVQLKPEKGRVEYAFAAAWEQEPDAIKTKEDFIKYANDQVNRLNNKIIIQSY